MLWDVDHTLLNAAGRASSSTGASSTRCSAATSRHRGDGRADRPGHPAGDARARRGARPAGHVDDFIAAWRAGLAALDGSVRARGPRRCAGAAAAIAALGRRPGSVSPC